MTLQDAIKIVANNPRLSPSEKRKALLKLGVQTEYQSHQGKKEMARRLKNLNRV